MAIDRILIVDDEEAIREIVSTLLQGQGYRCAVVGDGKKATQYLQNNIADVVLSDMVMPEMGGLEFVSWLHEHQPDIPVIMVTASHDVSTAVEAIRRGAYDYILKPFEKDQLFLSVRRAIEHRWLLLEN